MMKRWMAVLLSVILLVSVPVMAKMEVSAAPVEVGVTTLSDAAFFNPVWAQMNLLMPRLGFSTHLLGIHKTK